MSTDYFFFPKDNTFSRDRKCEGLPEDLIWCHLSNWNNRKQRRRKNFKVGKKLYKRETKTNNAESDVVELDGDYLWSSMNYIYSKCSLIVN